jgi:hypothetical protein
LLIPFASSGDPGCVQARASLRLPALEKLLARLAPAGIATGDEHSLSMPHERALAREFGLPHDDGRIPWAAWQLAQAGRDPQGAAWAWITPCHWDVGQDHVSMAHPRQLSLSGEESRELLATMQPWFEQDGISLEYEGPTQWLARGEVFRDLPAASLDRVTGRVIDRWMPRGDAGKAVRRLQQEMQMLLYTNRINEERSRGGLPTVNSFWVSGTGALPSGVSPRKKDGLQIINPLRDAALLQDWPAWGLAWHQVDGHDCARLLAALGRGEQVALTLCGERNARTFAGAGGGFFGKLRASLRPGSAAQIFESL